ncbi:serine hydrolase [Sediminitomix flava]|nr:serine hydrolase [Sediminitomix flava]
MNRIAQFAILFLLTFLSTSYPLLAQTSFQENLQKTLQASWEKTGVPGVALAVNTPEGENIFAAVGKGNTQVSPQTEMDTLSQFYIASISKTFTAALVLHLQDKKLLNIDDKLSDYLTIEGLPNADLITIRQLLNHSAGVYDHFDNSAFWDEAVDNPSHVWTAEEVLSYSNANGPAHQPNASYNYSNTGYYLLGLLVEEITGKSLREAFSDFITMPLELDDTFLDDSSSPTDKISNLAENYRAYEYHKSPVGAAGAMVSTPSDVAKFVKTIYGKDFLSEASLAEMIKPSANSSDYGLGTRLWIQDNIVHHGHTGTLTGYKSITFYIPSIDVSVAIHANGYAANGDTWWELVDDIFYAVVAEYNGQCIDGDCPEPNAPTLHYVGDNEEGELSISWAESPDSFVTGYRLLQSSAAQPTEWEVVEDESTLVQGVDSYSFSMAARENNESTSQFFKLQAVSADGDISQETDTYAYSPLGNNQRKLLIVDGFDRYGGSGSWGKAYHDFVADYSTIFEKVLDRDYSISSVANEVIVDRKIQLEDYEIVIWFTGDESTTFSTFSPSEQNLVKAYLNSGGQLFVCGSEIGWDLSVKGSATDKVFYNQYLKADFVDDGESAYSPAKSVNEYFTGTTLAFGEVYPEDYPDAIQPLGGAIKIFEFDQPNKVAGIAYKGHFGSGEEEGAVVYLSFPVESVSNQQMKEQFANQLITYFDMEKDEDKDDNLVTGFDSALQQKILVYPNPFSDYLICKLDESFLVTDSQGITLSVSNVLGKKFYRAESLPQSGSTEFRIDTHKWNSGVYILNVTKGTEKVIFKLIK